MDRKRFFVQPTVYMVIPAYLLLVPLKWLISWAIAVFVHEFGHYLIIRLRGYRVWKVEIGITGVCMHTSTMDSVSELWSALAGPFFGLLLLLVCKWFPRIALCGFVHAAYNLLPIFPLDGGRALRCILRRFVPLTSFENVYNAVNSILYLLMFVCVVVGTLRYSLGPIPLLVLICIAIKNKNTLQRNSTAGTIVLPETKEVSI